MTTPEQEARASLHVFYDDDSEEYWIAESLPDLMNVIDMAQGPLAHRDYGDADEWTQLDDGASKLILFTDSPDLGPSAMASEDDNPADCQEVTKTWGEWAAWHGRGLFGGGRT